jgi:hypothetical protein
MKKNSAFSLMEMSLVVMIVSLLIVGVIQTSYMVKQAKLSSAQLLTQNSPVNKTSDIVLWYETSLETSFDVSSEVDGTAISNWYDNNPEATTKNNATQSTSSYQPKFYDNVFNVGIPGIRFDGTDDYMDFDGSLLIGTSYTFFVVEQKRAVMSGANTGIFGGTSNTTGYNLYFGYNADTQIKFAHYSVSALGYTSSSLLAYSSPIARMHTGLFNTTSGQSYWLNGGSAAEATAPANTTVLSGYPGAALGKTNTNAADKYHNGDLAEIIIFKRALTTEERRSIETYLSKKYGITLS